MLREEHDAQLGELFAHPPGGPRPASASSRALLRSRVIPWWISALFLVGGPLGFVFASGTSGAVSAILIAGQAWRQTAA